MLKIIACLIAILQVNATSIASSSALVKRFIAAAKSGDRQTLCSLLDKVDINARDDLARTAVHYAVQHQQRFIVDTLVAKGADYNIIDADGKTPLDLLHQHRGNTELALPPDAITALEVIELIEAEEKTELLFKAVEDGDRKRIEQLLEEKANPKAKNKDGLFPFHIAAENKQPILAAILLKAIHGSVNGTDDKSWSPLQWAILGRDWAMVYEFLQEGATFSYRPPNSYRPYQDPYDIAHSIGKEERFIKLVKAARSEAVVKALTEKMIYSGDLELCALLVKHFPTYMLKNTMFAHYVLKTTINKGHAHIVEFLMASGVSKAAYMNRGLMLNYRIRGLPELANLLIKNGVDPDEPNTHGRVAIVSIYSAYDKEESVISARNLLEQGANPNIRDTSGNTPLLALAREAVRPANKQEQVNLLYTALQDLLYHGADHSIADHDGHTALMLLAGAQIHKHAYIGESNKRMLLHNSDSIARIVKALLKNGADPHKQDPTGKTTLDYARKYQLTKIIDLIEAHSPPDTATP